MIQNRRLFSSFIYFSFLLTLFFIVTWAVILFRCEAICFLSRLRSSIFFFSLITSFILYFLDYFPTTNFIQILFPLTNYIPYLLTFPYHTYFTVLTKSKNTLYKRMPEYVASITEGRGRYPKRKIILGFYPTCLNNSRELINPSPALE